MNLLDDEGDGMFDWIKLTTRPSGLVCGVLLAFSLDIEGKSSVHARFLSPLVFVPLAAFKYICSGLLERSKNFHVQLRDAYSSPLAAPSFLGYCVLL